MHKSAGMQSANFCSMIVNSYLVDLSSLLCANQTRRRLLPISNSCKQSILEQQLNQLNCWRLTCLIPPSSTTTPAWTILLGSLHQRQFLPHTLIRPLPECWVVPTSKMELFFSPGWTQPTQRGQLLLTITGIILSYNHNEQKQPLQWRCSCI